MEARLLLYALVAVVGLVVLIARFKVHSFIALIVASLFVGVTSGMEFRAIAAAFQDGMGAVLGSIAAVVGLGIVLGTMLEVSGGARVVASTLIGASVNAINAQVAAFHTVGLAIGFLQWALGPLPNRRSCDG